MDNVEFDINAPVDVNTLEEALAVIPTFFNIKSDAEGEKSPPGSDDFFGERATVHNNINNTKQCVVDNGLNYFEALKMTERVWQMSTESIDLQQEAAQPTSKLPDLPPLMTEINRKVKKQIKKQKLCLDPLEIPEYTPVSTIDIDVRQFNEPSFSSDIETIFANLAINPVSKPSIWSDVNSILPKIHLPNESAISLDSSLSSLSTRERNTAPLLTYQPLDTGISLQLTKSNQSANTFQTTNIWSRSNSNQRSSFSTGDGSIGEGYNDLLSDNFELTPIITQKQILNPIVNSLNPFMSLQHSLPKVENTAKDSNNSKKAVQFQLDSYFGKPEADKLDFLKHHLFFRKSIGDYLPNFNNLGEHHPGKTYFAYVCFKNARLDVFHYTEEQRDFMLPGNLILVQADRGYNVGKLVKIEVSLEEARLFRTKQNFDQGFNMGKSSNELYSVGLERPNKVLKEARMFDCNAINVKNSMEADALDFCRSKVIEFGLNMAITDAEYQWDLSKLTFHYECDHRVDFRELIRELFKAYKSRIWMYKVKKDTHKYYMGEI